MPASCRKRLSARPRFELRCSAWLRSSPRPPENSAAHRHGPARVTATSPFHPPSRAASLAQQKSPLRSCPRSPCTTPPQALFLPQISQRILLRISGFSTRPQIRTCRPCSGDRSALPHLLNRTCRPCSSPVAAACSARTEVGIETKH